MARLGIQADCHLNRGDMPGHPTDHAGLEILPFDVCLRLLSRLGLHTWVTAGGRPFWIRIRANAVSGRATPEAR